MEKRLSSGKTSLTEANVRKRKHRSMSREPRPAPLGRCALVWLAGSAALAALTGWLLPDLLAARDLAARVGLRGPPVRRGPGLALRGRPARRRRLAVAGHRPGRPRRRPRPRARSGAASRRRSGGWCWSPAAPPSPAAWPRRRTPPRCATPATGRRADTAVVEGLPLPDRATATMHLGHLVARRSRDARAARPRGPAAAHRGGPARRHVVGRWPTPPSPRTPPTSAVDDRWHRIYRANRAVIGADPDLIQPDQRLRLPRR